MSDPVTNFAIEDVLSSIRRLVSEGDAVGRPELFAQPAATDAAPGRNTLPQSFENADKFVLTPAFRISETRPDATPDTTRTPDPVSDVSWADPNPPLPFLRPAGSQSLPRSALEIRIAELEAAVTDQAGEWEPDGSEDVPVVDWSSPEVGESLVFSSRAMPQPDRRGVLNLGQVGTRIHPVILDEDLTVQPDVTAPASDFTAPAPDLGAPEPYDPGEDLDLSASDAADAVPFDDLAADAATAGDELDFLHGSGLLDEEALRRLVVDIVRQELQGPLGERITRNVRKMVRREIYRVLSSQEFES